MPPPAPSLEELRLLAGVGRLGRASFGRKLLVRARNTNTAQPTAPMPFKSQPGQSPSGHTARPLTLPPSCTRTYKHHHVAARRHAHHTASARATHVATSCARPARSSQRGACSMRMHELGEEGKRTRDGREAPRRQQARSQAQPGPKAFGPHGRQMCITNVLGECGTHAGHEPAGKAGAGGAPASASLAGHASQRGSHPTRRRCSARGARQDEFQTCSKSPPYCRGGGTDVRPLQEPALRRGYRMTKRCAQRWPHR